ncbi:hypothetical protein Scep_026334 [Stephania cephalantha]|uniref:Uncharacterized protein n=1 Tax=Stephania cephalantha TaxID=152367 RepID=A0AAP0EMH5_9MAGN
MTIRPSFGESDSGRDCGYIPVMGGSRMAQVAIETGVFSDVLKNLVLKLSHLLHMEQALGLEEGKLHFSYYQLVPWISWDEWNFVRESLFSSSQSSIATALRRILAWKSRGCLPVLVEVTASIIETQQMDPFFRNGLTDHFLKSDEMLAMLYSMAIMR